MHDEDDNEAPRRKCHHKKKHEKQSSSKHYSDSRNSASEERKKSSGRRGSYNTLRSSEDGLRSGDIGGKSSSHENFKYKERGSSTWRESTTKKQMARHRVKETQNKYMDEETHSKGRMESINVREKKEEKIPQNSKSDSSDVARGNELLNRHRKPVKLSEEERAARLLEMQMDAEIHEEQRWKRLKKAEENDVKEAVHAVVSKGRNFLDDVQKSVYGTDKGGSSTIEESVRRRTHYLQGRSEVIERNAFRR